jgi:hypothetical protein
MLVFEAALPGPSPLKVQPLSAVGSDTVKTRKRKLLPIQMLPGLLISSTIWFTSSSAALSVILFTLEKRCFQHEIKTF